MTRLAQCPSCHTEHQLADSDIGRPFQCTCGASLFPCAAAGFDSVPLYCPGCGEQYAVDPDDIGESMECECGNVVTVPDVVCRVSLGAPDAIAAAASAEKSSSSPTIECPRCQQVYDVSPQDIGETAECECGCQLKIGKDRSGKIVARVDTSAPVPVVIAEPEEPREKKPTRHAGPDDKKPVSWLAVIGFGSVGLFFLTAVVMFLLREKPTRTAKTEDNVQQISAEPESQAPKVKDDDLGAAGAAEASSADPSTGPDSGQTTDQDPALASAESPTASAAGFNDAGDSDSTGKSGGGRRRASERALPDPQPARPYIPVIKPRPSGYTFERAFRECFAEYEKTSKLRNDAKLSESESDVSAYHKQLGKTIGLMQQAHEIGMRSGENDQIHELRYLLTYLHFNAGHLAEAAVMGEAAARWGNVDVPATREAAMIALAAMQEASAVQWGEPENVGELRQMQAVAEVVADRWPEEPQLGEIWMLLAQLYEVFNHPDDSALMYERVPESSEHFATAQIAAGQAAWFKYLKRSADAPDDPEVAKLLDNARNWMGRGTRELLSESTKPTEQLASAKLSLSRMAMRAGDAEDAIRWITKPPLPLEEIITPDSAQASDLKIFVSREFVRLTYETLFQARTQQRDLEGAQLALSRVGELLGPAAAAKLGSLFLGAATDYVAELKASEVVTAEQIEKLRGLLSPLSKDQSSLTYSNVLWVGESFSEIGDKAATPELKVECYQAAADAYQQAMQRPDFPADSKASGWLRQITLLRGAGKPEQAIEVLERLLGDTPNAFGLQIEAAHALQEMALANGKPLELQAAIDGPTGNSPIWGWGQLVTTLHGVRFSESATEKSKEQFFEAQYNLVYCQWMIAKATADRTQRQELLESLSRQLKKILATTSSDSEPWYSKLTQLDQQIAAGK